MSQMPPQFLLGVGRRLAHVAREALVRRDDRAIPSRPDARLVLRCGIVAHHCLPAPPPPLTPPHKGEGNRSCSWRRVAYPAPPSVFSHASPQAFASSRTRRI